MTATTEVSKEQRGKLSPITQQLVQRLRNLQPGEFISYEVLSQVANCDVYKKCNYFLRKAIAVVESDYGIVLSNERYKGYIRLKNEEIDKYANKLHKRRLKGDTQRYRSKIECVDSSKLTLTQRIEHGLAIAQVALREAATSKSFEQQTRKKLASSPEQSLNMDALLEDMRGFG
jgi:hypothetical protein